MKKEYLHNIRLIFILGLLFVLVGFAKHRQASRQVQYMEVEFMDTDKLFITEVEVENLLKEWVINKNDSLINEDRLAQMESILDRNPMVKTSEVYYTLDGILSAQIVQREPIARVMGNESYYVDKDGLAMPLSPNYSSRVPLVIGVSKEDVKEIYPLLMKIQQDDFLKKHIIAIHKKSVNDFIFEVRDKDFVVHLGEISYLDKKLSNYKVFYSKALEYKKLDQYKRIDLQFGNQVVCTIK